MRYLRRTTLTILIILVTGLFTPVYGISTQDMREATATMPLASPPSISAQCAILVEAKSGRVLYEKNPDQKVYPASTTKIMTALLALEEGNPDEKVKVSNNAVGVEGSSIYLEKDEIIPLKDLIYGLMLRSGNDAAIAISEEIAGSVEDFVSLMNERAKEMGAENTHFMNPNGLHHDEHYTTARDMAKISIEAMKNPQFKEVAAAKVWTADRGEGKYNYFYNKNKVVYQYEGGTGIKIGYTKAAGRTLVASSEKDGMELICVVMNAPNWFQDTYNLMDYVYNLYETVRIAQGGTPLMAVLVDEGDKDFVYVGSKKDILCPVIKTAKDNEPGENVESLGGDNIGSEDISSSTNNIAIEYVFYDQAKAPIARWQQAGELKIYVDGDYIFSEPLYYLEDIETL
ncbi:MAG: D-alanyl-D-alanine carboxypeptidase family protein [Anaerovoracaceae bacterium]|jgi:D-alanyl-D-alanine carboxypeptidase (penicillin-binding protein 5/6)